MALPKRRIDDELLELVKGERLIKQKGVVPHLTIKNATEYPFISVKLLSARAATEEITDTFHPIADITTSNEYDLVWVDSDLVWLGDECNPWLDPNQGRWWDSLPDKVMVNYVPGTCDWTYKQDNLCRLLRNIKKENRKGILPCYVLPTESNNFEKLVTTGRIEEESLWLYKVPMLNTFTVSTAKSAVKTFSTAKKTQYKLEQQVMQQYLPSPMLVGGKKMDMRVYLVAFFDPSLSIFMHQEGLASIAEQPFALDSTDPGVHSTAFGMGANTALLGNLNHHRTAAEIRLLYPKLNWHQIWEDIGGIASKVLGAMSELVTCEKTGTPCGRTFAALSADFSLDSKGTPHLLKLHNDFGLPMLRAFGSDKPAEREYRTMYNKIFRDLLQILSSGSAGFGNDFKPLENS